MATFAVITEGASSVSLIVDDVTRMVTAVTATNATSGVMTVTVTRPSGAVITANVPANTTVTQAIQKNRQFSYDDPTALVDWSVSLTTSGH